jgi:two-component system sensor histidine kinase KdpD
MKGHFNLTTNTILLIALTVWIAINTSLWLAIVAAAENFLFLNYLFTPPFHTFVIADKNDLISLLAFIVASITASLFLNQLKSRNRKLQQRSEEGAFLSNLATEIVRGHNSIDEILEFSKSTFVIEEIAVVTKIATIPQTEVRVIYGEMEDVTWEILSHEVKLNSRYSLLSKPPILEENVRNQFTTFGSQILILLERQALDESKRQLTEIREADQMRSALLAAVSHDLRGPLASSKAAISSLMNREIEWSKEDRRELLDTADQSLNQLNGLIENLLDMSRLEANAISIHWRTIEVADAISGAVKSLKERKQQVIIKYEPDLPSLTIDPILLERVLVNLIENALRFSPLEKPAEIEVSSLPRSIIIKVIDHGPGVSLSNRSQMFLPFQRLGDRDNKTGVGLGLAIVKGFTELMKGDITVEETPSGGATMVLTFPSIPTETVNW